jgi:hypothetical protein
MKRFPTCKRSIDAPVGASKECHMVTGKDARRSNSLDAELDALVAREVDALALRQVRASPKARAPREDAAGSSAAHEIERETLEFPTHRPREAAGQPAKSKSSSDNVIGIRHGGLPGGTDVLGFSAEEAAFVEHAVAFLRERCNADVIIEEVWHHSVLDRHDNGPNQRLGSETQVADELAALDEGAQTEGTIPPADPAPSADYNRVMPLQRSMTEARARGGTEAETVPANSAQPASPRGKQKRDNGEREKDSDS